MGVYPGSFLFMFNYLGALFWTLGKIMLLFLCHIKVGVYELSHCHNLTLVTAL